MIEKLMDYGLSEKEAKIYLECLKLGEATANRISEMADYPRSTTYDILEKLKNIGLISTCIIDNKTNFIANSPKTLGILLEEKKESLNSFLPDLEKMYKQVKAKPIAEVFQGKKSLIKIFNEILDNAKELLVMGSEGNALEKAGYHPKKFRVKRIDNNIKIKQILDDSLQSREIPLDNLTEIKFLKSFENSKEGTFIFDDYVYHVIFQYEITIIKIKSKEHADSTRIIFEELWEKSKNKSQ